ncbi:MAG: S1 family peptidase [Pseudolabrys sp.]|nr:S1 family peptidase [Pseudolabrys sp.]
MRFVGTVCLLALSLVVAARPAAAMVGNAPPAPMQGRHAVMIVGSGGTFCTGAAIARDLVLTAAHCVQPGSDYKLVEFDAAHSPQLLDVTSVSRHPNFNIQTLLAHRATADVALLKLAAPLPVAIIPAAFATADRTPQVGDHYLVTGYGLAVRHDGKTGGTLRSAELVATGKPGNLQIRLVDPDRDGKEPGLGACTGDSGAPVYDGTALIGVVSWSTGPRLEGGCGGLTGVTPLTLYRGWIVDQARRLGSPVGP